jgi:hypothetical protein
LLSANHKIIIPILLSLFILLGLVATVFIIRKKSTPREKVSNHNEKPFELINNVFHYRNIGTKPHFGVVTVRNAINCEHYEQAQR